MIRFSSKKEKRLWIYSLLVCCTIISTLLLGAPLQQLLKNQNVQALVFVVGMILTTITIFIHSNQVFQQKYGLTLVVGIIAVYTMFFLRLGISERSHLIEYSILTVFVQSSLLERYKAQEVKGFKIGFGTFLITFSIGLIDESIQKIIPGRVFDVEDIVFNGTVIVFTILTINILKRLNMRLFNRSKQ